MNDESSQLTPKTDMPPMPPTSARKSEMTSSQKKRLAIGFTVACISDLLSVWLEILPPLQLALDFVTAFLLFLILGRQWAILPAFIAEAIPGVALFPSWVLVVISVSVWGTINPQGKKQLAP